MTVQAFLKTTGAGDYFAFREGHLIDRSGTRKGDLSVRLAQDAAI